MAALNVDVAATVAKYRLFIYIILSHQQRPGSLVEAQSLMDWRLGHA